MEWAVMGWQTYLMELLESQKYEVKDAITLKFIEAPFRRKYPGNYELLWEDNDPTSLTVNIHFETDQEATWWLLKS
jgi:hypothetical protein